MSNNTYRKKPITVQAVQISKAMAKDMPQWLWHAVDKGTVILLGQNPYEDRAPWAEIESLEGVMTALAGDWIIQGVKGEIYSCKDDIFKMTYEKVPEDVAPPERVGGRGGVKRFVGGGDGGGGLGEHFATITTSPDAFTVAPGTGFVKRMTDDTKLVYGKTVGEAERADMHRKLDEWIRDRVREGKARDGAVDVSGDVEWTYGMAKREEGKEKEEKKMREQRDMALNAYKEGKL